MSARWFWILTLTVSSAAPGCAGVSNLFDSALIRLNHHQQMASIRHETRQQLSHERTEAFRMAAERDRQQAQIDLERSRLEVEFCQANQQAQRQMLQSQIRDQIESKVAFNVQQGLDVGELEVDIEKLEELLRQRKRDQQQTQKQLQQAYQKGCSCAQKECGCEPGLKKRDCHRCRHCVCDQPEPGCGGPAALEQALQQAQNQPQLRPTEIPMKLPVRLSFGIQRPQIEETRIHRLPVVLPPAQPQKDAPPHQKYLGNLDCADCANGFCPLHQHVANVGELPPPPVPTDY